jgi:polyhydroxyalkanoate synthesis regulator phasin
MSSEEFVYKSDLEKTPLAEILATVNRYGVPGVLELEHDGVVKRVYLLDGDIIFATSTDRSESLGDYLVRAGEITEEELQASSDELANSPGARHGEILVKMGFLDRERLGAAVRKQVQSILWSLFNWSEGQVTFKVGRSKDDEVFKIKIPAARAIIAGCRRIEDPKMITARMGGRGAILKKLPRPPHLEKVRLEPDERELLELVDGKKTLYELCESGPASAGANARVLYAFAELQMLTVDPSSSGKILIQVRG